LSFELLYAKYAPAVKAYVLRRADASNADDVVAEVFVVCWRRFEDVPVDPLPWLLGVARRVLSTQRRSERRRAALHDRFARTVGEPTSEVPDFVVGEASTSFAGEMPAGFAADALHSSTGPRPAQAQSGALVDIADAELAGALACLSGSDRELLLLIAWDGLSPAEAAEVLDIKPATARVRLLRARRRLTQALSRERSDPATCSSLSMEASS
jgi:RNA polymerase sigma factor (sigma-70 family)